MITFDDKNKKLSNLVNEVRDIHPLLKTLFNSMDAISEVLHTHGQNEMGADFVLVKNDDILEITRYIGVIVKSTSINQSSEDVFRQIDECNVPRKVEGGAKKIILNEIWVLTTKNISNNMQEKIHTKFPGKNVTFIDGGKIVSLIDKYIPKYWTSDDIVLNSYLNNMEAKILKYEKEFQIIPFSEYTYIEQKIDIRKECGESCLLKSKKIKSINIIEEVLKNKVSLVEGGIGTGKSKLQRHIGISLIHNNSNESNSKIPILCSFDDFINIYNLEPGEVIKKKIPNDISQDSEFLFLIDGVDEVFSLDKEEKLIESISKISKVENFSAVFFVRLFPSNSADALIATHWYSIRSFTFEQIVSLIKATCGQMSTPERLINDLKKSQLFKNIQKSPIATFLLAKILMKNPKHDLPSTLTDLYSKFFEIILGRWDVERGIKREKDYLIVRNFIKELACIMIKSNRTSIPRNEFYNVLQKYIVDRNFEDEVGVGLIKDELFVFSKVLTEINDNVKFAQHSFFEFFVADYFCKTHELEIDKKAFDLRWVNIYYFYIGLHGDCKEIIEKIVQLDPDDNKERLVRIFALGSYLMAGFLTPYIHTKDCFYKVFLDAANLYTDFLKNNSSSPFNYMPQLFILMVFSALIRENYSYDFFKSAIGETIINIDCSDVVEKEKILALFFLSVVELDLGEASTLTYLIDNYFHKLPSDVILALDIENKDSKLVGLKKNSKRIKQLAKTQNFKNAIRQLTSIPIFQVKKTL